MEETQGSSILNGETQERRYISLPPQTWSWITCLLNWIGHPFFKIDKFILAFKAQIPTLVIGNSHMPFTKYLASWNIIKPNADTLASPNTTTASREGVMTEKTLMTSACADLLPSGTVRRGLGTVAYLAPSRWSSAASAYTEEAIWSQLQGFPHGAGGWWLACG